MRPSPPYHAPEPPPPVRHPLQTCDACDRAFRAPAPGHCRDCRTDLPEGHATRKDFVYGEDVTIADWTIPTQGLPLYGRTTTSAS
ncbi:hypothetical protein ACFY98_11010 [Streptomyces tricolor]|uniref:hypothetical protein n=1 Tax=Streptomyces tricolor TaxID=68277 RepID=UPI0036EBC89C